MASGTSNFSQIKVGDTFEAKGAKYRKVDDLYYEDLSSGFLSVWSPLFDAGIGSTIPPVTKSTSKEPEFLTDPQTRVQTRNPDFGKTGEDPATHWMGEMWGLVSSIADRKTLSGWRLHQSLPSNQ